MKINFRPWHESTISGVLDASKQQKATKIKGYFDKDGQCEITIVDQQNKPDNEVIMMKLLRKLLKLGQGKYQDNNLEDVVQEMEKARNGRKMRL